jgi:transcriptional regulator with XRE-family HTH domain
MSKRRRKYIHRARRLYARGLSRKEVAEAVGVAKSTVQRWARHDARQGRDWQDARRRCQQRRPTLIIERLEDCFARLLSHKEEQEQAGKGKKKLEDRLLKLLRVIELYRKTRDDSETQLAALEDFVAFCVRQVPADDMEVIRGAVNSYIEHLKRENS